MTAADVIDHDGKAGKKKRFQPCHQNDPNKRHRAPKASINFTTGCINCRIGILIYYGSLGTTKSPKNSWMEIPYGIYAPWVQNTMTRDAFIQCRSLIHLCGIIHVRYRITSKYDPLAKAKYVLNQLMSTMRKGWIVGKRITVDESMIKYCDRAISFIQYIPKKPITHGITVFALCCSYT